MSWPDKYYTTKQVTDLLGISPETCGLKADAAILNDSVYLKSRIDPLAKEMAARAAVLAQERRKANEAARVKSEQAEAARVRAEAEAQASIGVKYVPASMAKSLLGRAMPLSAKTTVQNGQVCYSPGDVLKAMRGEI